MLNCYFDHQNFYIKDKSFYPIASSDINNSECNTVVIPFDCSNRSTLSFEKQYELALLSKNKNKYIIWDLSLGIEDNNFPITDDLFLKSILHSLNYFISKLYTPFQGFSIGVILYSGHMPNYELQNNTFEDWLNSSTDQQKSSFNISYLKKVFSCDLLANYLRLIAPSIPDELPMIVKLDVSDIKSSSQLISLLSKERFEYFLLALKGTKIRVPAIQWEHGKSANLGIIDGFKNILKSNLPKVGVCFTSNENITKNELDQFDRIFDQLSSINIDFRVIEESLTTEQWDESDYIIARKSSLTLQGKRALQGFSAASGVTVYHDFPIGVLNEIDFKSFQKIILLS